MRTRLGRLELSRRVALLSAVAVGLAVALTALAAYVTVRQELLRQVDTSLLSRARAAVSSSLGDVGALARLPLETAPIEDTRHGDSGLGNCLHRNARRASRVRRRRRRQRGWAAGVPE